MGMGLSFIHLIRGSNILLLIKKGFVYCHLLPKFLSAHKMPQPPNLHEILTPMIGSTPIPNLSPELQEDHNSSYFDTPSPDRRMGDGQGNSRSPIKYTLARSPTKYTLVNTQGNGSAKYDIQASKLTSIIDAHQMNLPELSTIQASLKELKKTNTTRIHELEEYLRKLRQSK